MCNNIRILDKPAMSGDFEQIGPLAWVGDKDSPKKVTGVRRNVLGECEGSRDDVFIQDIDVVAFRICRVIVER